MKVREKGQHSRQSCGPEQLEGRNCLLLEWRTSQEEKVLGSKLRIGSGHIKFEISLKFLIRDLSWQLGIGI